jgi:hypothetical protein
MIHIRYDNDEAKYFGHRYACGLDTLPEGHKWLYPGIVAHADATCPGCNPSPRPIGTPLSQLSGRPGHPGFARFCEIARSWGYE